MINSSKTHSHRLVLLVIGFILVNIISFGLGLIFNNCVPILSTTKNFSELIQSFSLLQKYYYETLPEKKDLEYGMINGMLQVVGDPHTVFIEPIESELQTDQLTGSFGGIGAKLERDTNGNLFLYPYQDSAAQKAGIQAGDKLLKVDELKITPEVSTEEVQAAIRGKIGQSIQLVIGRSAPDFSEITIMVVREEVSIPSVIWHITSQDERVGVIQVNIIAATTPEEIKKAVLDLQSQGSEYFILDLRNNTGGLLEAGIQTAELFLEKGVIIQQQYRDKPAEEIRSDKDGQFVDLPVTVIINDYTASAAEIIAGSFQARQYAKLIGSNSYGKDTIQFVFDLNDGSSLHVTTAQWWIPGLGYSIHGQGLIPDISLSVEDTNSQKAIETAIQTMVK